MPDTTTDDREAKEKEYADKLLKRLTEIPDVENVEPLGDLNVPVKEVLSTILALRHILSLEDTHKMMLIIGILYGCKDEHEFMLRLAKTVKDMAVSGSDMEITSQV